jgi:hypothetical protein
MKLKGNQGLMMSEEDIRIYLLWANMLLIAYLAREEMNCNDVGQTVKKEYSLFLSRSC